MADMLKIERFKHWVGRRYVVRIYYFQPINAPQFFVVKNATYIIIKVVQAGK